MKKWMVVVISVIFVTLLTIAAILLFKLNPRKLPPAKEGSKKANVNVVFNQPANPIKKSILKDNGGIDYQIFGKFDGEIEKIEGRKDNAYGGKFVIDGDPLSRQISVMFFGYPVFGRYQGSFQGNSNWKAYSLEDLKKELKPDEKVLLTAEYYLDNSGEVPDYVAQAQEVMDTLINEFNVNKFGYSIPSGFQLIGRGVGVVR